MDKVTCTHCGTNNPEKNKYCSNCGYELPKIAVEKIDNQDEQLKSKKNISAKKFLGFVFGIIAFGLCYFAVQQLFFKAPQVDKEIMKIANEINKTCPIMIDSETRLDNAISLPGNKLQYFYTLINYGKASIDTLEMRNRLEPIITNFVKTNPQMKFLRDHETTINYYYKDKEGLFLLLISVTPEKYH